MEEKGGDDACIIDKDVADESGWQRLYGIMHPAHPSGRNVARKLSYSLLRGLQVLRIGFAATLIRDQIERYTLPFMQSCHARLLDSTDMNKNVRRSILGGYEAKALLGVEKLYSTNWHYNPSRVHAQLLRGESLHRLFQQLKLPRSRSLPL